MYGEKLPPRLAMGRIGGSMAGARASAVSTVGPLARRGTARDVIVLPRTAP